MNTLPQNIPSRKSKKPYVYKLAYPDGYIDQSLAGITFYIGKGRGHRILQHEYKARGGGKDYKHNVIRKIWANGYKVEKEILAYFETDEEANIYEIALIFFMDGLTNLTDGGEGIVGLVRTEEHRNKISESIKTLYTDEEYRRRRKGLLKGRTHTEEQNREHSERMKGRQAWNKGLPGKSVSTEERQRRSETLKGRPTPWLQTPEARKKNSEVRRKKATEKKATNHYTLTQGVLPFYPQPR